MQRLLFSLFSPNHPRHRRYLRWRIAQYSAFSLFFGGLALLFSLALAMAFGYIATEAPGPGLPHADRAFRPLWLMLDCLRALLGSSDFTGQPDNLAHQILTTFASIIGALFPALVIGIAIVRIFAMRVFEWRSHISVCLAAELDDDLRAAIADPVHGFLAVRWYKRLDNLALVNLRAEAYLRLRTVSEHDGSTFYRYQLLDVLDVNGHRANRCLWPETFSGMPFTLWIPLDDGLVNGRIATIQGRPLAEENDRHLVVRLTGGVAVGPATQISEERRYHLRDHVQVGRFVPVDPDIDTPARSWPGWRDFDRPVTHHVFLYDELISPDELRKILGHDPLPGEVRIASLRDWRVSWSGCLDNTDPGRKKTYFTPGSATPEAWQILFPTVLPDGGSTANGLVVSVTPEQLAALDRREGVHSRRRVNNEVVVDGNHSGHLSGVVWMYVAHGDSVERAAAGLRQGTARIDRAFLSQLQDAYLAHPKLNGALDKIALPRVPIVDLEKRHHDCGATNRASDG